MLFFLFLAASSGARASDTFGGYAFYLGDIHAHSSVSGDGGAADVGTTCASDCGNFADLYQTARDNGLDFAAVADHVNGPRVAANSADYDALVDLTIAEDDPAGGFITLPAAEVWFKAGTTVLGHKTLLMFGDDTTLAGLTQTDVEPVGTTGWDVTSCTRITTWATNLEATFGHLLLVPHHPAATAPMPTDWSCYDETYEPMVEVYSEHGSSLGDGEGYDPMWSGEVASGTVKEAIDPDGDALRLGFSAGTDKHNSRPGDVCNIDTQMPRHPYGGGLTIVVADESESFSRDLIYDAMVSHHTLATSGPLVPVTLSFSSGGAALGGLGDELGLPEGQELDVALAVPEALATYVTGVELVTPDGRFSMDDDGAGAYTYTLDAADAAGYVYAQVAVDGGAWYGAAGCDDGGSDDAEYIWSSPSYIDPVAGDLDGDGQAVADGDCDDGDATVYDGAAEVADDGVDQDCDGADLVTPADTGADTEGEAEGTEADTAVEADAEAAAECAVVEGDAAAEADAADAEATCATEEPTAAEAADADADTLLDTAGDPPPLGDTAGPPGEDDPADYADDEAESAGEVAGAAAAEAVEAAVEAAAAEEPTVAEEPAAEEPATETAATETAATEAAAEGCGAGATEAEASSTASTEGSEGTVGTPSGSPGAGTLGRRSGAPPHLGKASGIRIRPRRPLSSASHRLPGR